jgi:flagellar biosynthesis chaperone FliJ
MSAAMGRLLDLRRSRERQAEIELSRALAEWRRQTDHVAELERRLETFTHDSNLHIAALYRATVGGELGPSGIDILIETVDAQYRLQRDMRVLVATQKRLLDQLDEAVAKARATLNERRRTVLKLTALVEEIARDAARAAEIAAEAEAERPFIRKAAHA